MNKNLAFHYSVENETGRKLVCVAENGEIVWPKDDNWYGYIEDCPYNEIEEV